MFQEFSALQDTMVHNSGFCKFLIVLLGLFVAITNTESLADPGPTLQGDNQDTVSGGGAYDDTTKEPFQGIPDKSTTSIYEDTTDLTTLEQEGILGPGEIAAIVIAVFLGASVLLALIVITLRKLTAS